MPIFKIDKWNIFSTQSSNLEFVLAKLNMKKKKKKKKKKSTHTANIFIFTAENFKTFSLISHAIK